MKDEDAVTLQQHERRELATIICRSALSEHLNPFLHKHLKWLSSTCRKKTVKKDDVK